MDPLDPLLAAGAAYADELYQRYRVDPASVDRSWAALFRACDRSGPVGRAGGFARPVPAGAEAAAGLQINDVVHTYRQFGHLIAQVDPLRETPGEHPFLELRQFGLSEPDLDRVVTCGGYHGTDRATVRRYIELLRETYSGPIGVEYMDVTNASERDWLQRQMEPIRNRPRLSRQQRLALLRQLVASDAFEETLQSMYVGAKRFSLEGATTLITLLNTIVDEAARHDIEQIALGMAHRGRLNVLANVLGKPLEYILAEFEGRPLAAEIQGYGDVKYHLGYSTDRALEGGGSVHLSLAFNPSHLEAVDPVIEGIVRAKQHLVHDRERTRVVPVLVHGDAAFTGQGIVAETLTLARLGGYCTGGTFHIIANNQIGFTATPAETRSTHYPSDIAKIIRAPIFHVNADHPEAVKLCAEIALAFRQRFHRDVVIDLVCFRRHGHNELDDPSYTQPVMTRLIDNHRPVSEIYAHKLGLDDIVSADEVKEMRAEHRARMNAARDTARAMPEQVTQQLGGTWTGITTAGDDWSADTAVPRQRLEEIARALTRVPDGFHWHKRLSRLMAERAEMVLAPRAPRHPGASAGGRPERRIDWGCGEALAIGSLLLEGKHVRLSGQDSARGTFSHRHAVYHDMETGAPYAPLAHLAAGQGDLEVINSPLSEAAALGFEYGYSSADPWGLVIWEAQFGDFANGAQVIIDQLIAGAEYKWGRMSGLVMLLPHGYEGQGPEHSSARLERFLELCAEGNMQVCNLSTPAQLFHALRRQLCRDFRKPLVVMSPKSLLRHPQATSTLRDFTDGRFEPILDDPHVSDREAVSCALMCSGKIYYALDEVRRSREIADVAIIRLEELYPYPLAEVRALLAAFPNLRRLRWVQEEPRNMGAWRNLLHRFEASTPPGVDLEYVGRDSRAVPATGAHHVHAREEEELVDLAFEAEARSRALPRGTGHVLVQRA